MFCCMCVSFFFFKQPLGINWLCKLGRIGQVPFVVYNKTPGSLGRVGAGPAGDGKTHTPALQMGSGKDAGGMRGRESHRVTAGPPLSG